MAKWVGGRRLRWATTPTATMRKLRSLPTDHKVRVLILSHYPPQNPTRNGKRRGQCFFEALASTSCAMAQGISAQVLRNRTARIIEKEEIKKGGSGQRAQQIRSATEPVDARDHMAAATALGCNIIAVGPHHGEFSHLTSKIRRGDECHNIVVAYAHNHYWLHAEGQGPTDFWSIGNRIVGVGQPGDANYRPPTMSRQDFEAMQPLSGRGSRLLGHAAPRL